MKTNLYDVEVRPTSNSDFFQYYTETVEAHTANDAVRMVERRNPDCNCKVTDIEYRSDSFDDDDSDYSSSYSDSDSSLGLGNMFGSVIMVGLGLVGIVMLTTGEDSNNYQPDNTSVIENIQKTFSDIAPAKDHPLQFNIRELPKSTPAQYRAEENGCDIWRKAQPALAAQLQPGDKCYR